MAAFGAKVKGTESPQLKYFADHSVRKGMVEAYGKARFPAGMLQKISTPAQNFLYSATLHI